MQRRGQKPLKKKCSHAQFVTRRSLAALPSGSAKTAEVTSFVRTLGVSVAPPTASKSLQDQEFILLAHGPCLRRILRLLLIDLKELRVSRDEEGRQILKLRF